MRKAGARHGLVVAGALVTGIASAQGADSQPKSPAKYKAQPLNMRRQQLGTQAMGETGRERMRKGDWAGALEAFDIALRTSTDAALYRDRGRCHEQLGHAYPAIDDYRKYLTAVPDGPDADGVRERLAKLEQETLGYSSASTDVPGDVEGGASAAVSHESGGKTSVTADPSTSSPRNLMDAARRDDDSLDLPLRRGKGWALGPAFSEHKWGASPSNIALENPPKFGASFGDNGTWAECVGLEGRYSFGPSGAVVLAAAYEHFNSTAVDVAVVSGLSSEVAYEWRSALDSNYKNQLILAPGLGYEHLAIHPTDPSTPSASLGAFVPRVRFGWRHLLAPSAALDVSLDGGVTNFFRYSHFPFDSHGNATFLAGLNIALLWGL
jgi:tetratricopeptide (TPR) repeat protein